MPVPSNTPGGVGVPDGLACAILAELRAEIRGSPPRGDQERIADILKAAHQIEQFTAPGRDAYMSDPMVRLPIERLLSIIGVAARNVSPDGRARCPDVPWPEVVRFRALVARYDRVDNDRVWEVATKSVPELLKQLQRPSS